MEEKRSFVCRAAQARVVRRRVNARIRKKYLRSAERLFVDTCRLYANRPRGDAIEAQFAKLAEDLLAINLMITFYQWSRVGPSRLRQSAVVGVDVKGVQDLPGDRIQLAGTVRWSRRHAGVETEVVEPFRVECAVPRSRRALKTVRPTIVVGVAGGHAV